MGLDSGDWLGEDTNKGTGGTGAERKMTWHLEEEDALKNKELEAEAEESTLQQEWAWHTALHRLKQIHRHLPRNDPTTTSSNRTASSGATFVERGL